MAAIPVTIVGMMSYSGLDVGGGPMPGGPFPSHPIAPGGPPPGYWGGVAPPLPTHPIAPGGPPPGGPPWLAFVSPIFGPSPKDRLMRRFTATLVRA